MDRNKVLLVDKKDTIHGEMDKIEAHIKGALHRAFSIFIFNKEGNLLLQQRAFKKYHGGGLWTNTCCSHPQLNESVIASAEERLQFEMGLSCELTAVYSFIYHARVENNLTEHELDHVLIGTTESRPVINKGEVANYKWMDPEDVLSDIARNPLHYTLWFRKALPVLLSKIRG